MECPVCRFEIDDDARHCRMCYAPIGRALRSEHRARLATLEAEHLWVPGQPAPDGPAPPDDPIRPESRRAAAKARRRAERDARRARRAADPHLGDAGSRDHDPDSDWGLSHGWKPVLEPRPGHESSKRRRRLRTRGTAERLPDPSRERPAPEPPPAEEPAAVETQHAFPTIPAGTVEEWRPAARFEPRLEPEAPAEVPAHWVRADEAVPDVGTPAVAHLPAPPAPPPAGAPTGALPAPPPVLDAPPPPVAAPEREPAEAAAPPRAPEPEPVAAAALEPEPAPEPEPVAAAVVEPVPEAEPTGPVRALPTAPAPASAREVPASPPRPRSTPPPVPAPRPPERAAGLAARRDLPATLGGVPWTAPHQPPPPPDPARRRRLVKIAAGALAAIVAGGGAVVAVNELRPSDYPESWDGRVAGIAGDVEDLRGLEFEHPVPVEFLPEPEFREEILAGGGSATDEDTERLEREAGTLRALALLEGDNDLLGAVEDLSTDGILAFYDDEDERVVVKGTRLDVSTRVTVAHELTHALDDQHFDLGTLKADADSEAKLAALRSLIEGDATYVESLYLETLPADEQHEYQELSLRDFGAQVQQVDAPEILLVSVASPYEYGPTFVDVLERQGETVVDEAFRVPPVTEEQIIDPSSYIEGDEPEPVTAPAPPAGVERRGGAEEFGALGWYFTLASRVDAGTALRAIEGWGGDAYTQFDRRGVPCANLTFSGDTTRDTTEMGDALQQWVAARPPGAAAVEYGAGTVTLTSCEAVAAPAPPNSLLDAARLLAVRQFLVIGMLESGEELATAQCQATEIAATPGARALVEVTDPDDPRLTELVAGLADEAALAAETCVNRG